MLNTPINIVPLCNYTLFLVTLKVLGTFPEVILWKTFTLFRHILNDVSSRPVIADFSRGRGNGQKSAGDRSGGYGGCSSVVTLFFNKKSLTKTDRCAGALSWRRHQLFFFYFSGIFFLTGSLWLWRILLTFLYLQFYNFPDAEILVIIPANSGKFWSSYILLLLLSSSSPLCRVFILIFLRKTMSIGNKVLQLFCCFYSWCLYR